MKKLIATTIAAAATFAMFSAPSFADTKMDDEPVFGKVAVNKVAKTNLARAGLKTYHGAAAVKAYDFRKVSDHGMADKR